MGLDFEQARRKLMKIIESNEYTQKEKLYASVLLIQLLNGLRVSEAWTSMQHFLTTKERDFQIKPGKRGAPRPVKIPEIVKQREEWKWILNVEPNRARKRLHYYAKTFLGTNTHSLRYALVGYLSGMGVSAQIIAKITGHKKLDRILQYTQSIQAEKILDEIIK